MASLQKHPHSLVNRIYIQDGDPLTCQESARTNAVCFLEYRMGTNCVCCSFGCFSCCLKEASFRNMVKSKREYEEAAFRVGLKSLALQILLRILWPFLYPRNTPFLHNICFSMVFLDPFICKLLEPERSLCVFSDVHYNQVLDWLWHEAVSGCQTQGAEVCPTMKENSFHSSGRWHHSGLFLAVSKPDLLGEYGLHINMHALGTIHGPSNTNGSTMYSLGTWFNGYATAMLLQQSTDFLELRDPWCAFKLHIMYGSGQ